MKLKTLAVVALFALISIASNCGESIDMIEKISIDKYAYIATVPFEPPYMYQKGGELVGPDAMLGKAIVDRIQEMQPEGSTPIRLNWVNRTYSSLVDALKHGEVNLVVGVFVPTEERKQEIAFSNPYNELDLALVFNPINKIMEPANIPGARIGVREGTGIESYARQKFPQAQIVPLKTVDDAVLALRRGEVHGIIADRLMAAYALCTVPGTGEMEIHPDSLGTLPVAAGLPKGDEKFLKLVNEVIADLKDELEAAKAEHAQDYLEQVMERRRERLDFEKKQQAPRDITIRVSRAKGFTDFDIYRMANLRFEFRGGAGVVRSTPVQFRGSTGVCTAKVPPGDYMLAQPKFNFAAPVNIGKNEPSRITISITVTKTGVTLNKR